MFIRASNVTKNILGVITPRFVVNAPAVYNNIRHYIALCRVTVSLRSLDVSKLDHVVEHYPRVPTL